MNLNLRSVPPSSGGDRDAQGVNQMRRNAEEPIAAHVSALCGVSILSQRLSQISHSLSVSALSLLVITPYGPADPDEVSTKVSPSTAAVMALTGKNWRVGVVDELTLSLGQPLRLSGKVSSRPHNFYHMAIIMMANMPPSFSGPSPSAADDLTFLISRLASSLVIVGGDVIVHFRTPAQISKGGWYQGLVPEAVKRYVEGQSLTPTVDVVRTSMVAALSRSSVTPDASSSVAINVETSTDPVAGMAYFNVCGPLLPTWRRTVDAMWDVLTDDEKAHIQSKMGMLMDEGSVGRYFDENDAGRRFLGASTFCIGCVQ